MSGQVPRGRGRISSIDLLPEEAAEDVAWAHAEINRRKMHQQDILEQLNLRLRLKGIKPISASAFNRKAIRTIRMAHRLGETRDIAAVLAEKFEDGPNSDLTMLAAETIKMLLFELLENAQRLKADGFTAEMMANFALALKSAEQAKKISTDMKVIHKKAFEKQATEAINRVGAVKGLTPEMKEAFKRELFGIVDGV